MFYKIVLIFIGLIVFINKVILQDYSTTIVVFNGDTEMLYPAWPVELKSGYW
jgi:hypothetical protein